MIEATLPEIVTEVIVGEELAYYWYAHSEVFEFAQVYSVVPCVITIWSDEATADVFVRHVNLP